MGLVVHMLGVSNAHAHRALLRKWAASTPAHPLLAWAVASSSTVTHTPHHTHEKWGVGHGQHRGGGGGALNHTSSRVHSTTRVLAPPPGLAGDRPREHRAVPSVAEGGERLRNLVLCLCLTRGRALLGARSLPGHGARTPRLDRAALLRPRPVLAGVLLPGSQRTTVPTQSGRSADSAACRTHKGVSSSSSSTRRM